MKQATTKTGTTGQDGGGAFPVVCKLCDFGISAIFDSSSAVEEVRVQTIAMGSPAFMAPEVAAGHAGKAEYSGSCDV